LCNFSLSRLENPHGVDRESLHVEREWLLGGSVAWMSPELIQGLPLRLPCDIYSFGMTIYEVYTGQIPFGPDPPSLLIDLILQNNIRPEKPNPDSAPHFTYNIWELAEQCWVKEATERPSAYSVSLKIGAFIRIQDLEKSPKVDEVNQELRHLELAKANLTLRHRIMIPGNSDDILFQGSGGLPSKKHRPPKAAVADLNNKQAPTHTEALKQLDCETIIDLSMKTKEAQPAQAVVYHEYVPLEESGCCSGCCCQ